MKKVKWSLMSLAVLFSICAAFATRPRFDCSNMTQYYFQGGIYLEAGTEGIDYQCETGTGTCTYYTADGIHYFTCALGQFDNCMGCAVRPTSANSNAKSNQPNTNSSH